MITKTQNQREPYSEHQAASMLGLSVDQLRSMVKAHVVKDGEVPEDWIVALQPSDLFILKVLSGIPNPSAKA